MTRYKLWVRLDSGTAFTFVYAENAIYAMRLGEAQYGRGNVLSCFEE